VNCICSSIRESRIWNSSPLSAFFHDAMHSKMLNTNAFINLGNVIYR
jgi:hypothetical protein